MNGYDESNYQGDINNAIVPGGFDIIKATEGIGYRSLLSKILNTLSLK